jgi:hypothetical protein
MTTAIEQLRNLVGSLDYEYEDILDDLPSIEALIAYRALWDVYDTEYLDGIVECIGEGDDPAAYNAFVEKYNLPWRKL